MKPHLLASAALGLVGLAAPSSAQDLVVVNEFGALDLVNSQTGCVTQVLGIGGLNEINAMARRKSDGALFVAGGWNLVTNPVLYEMDPQTGAVVGQVPLAGVDGVRGMAFDDVGNLWVIDDNGYGPPDDLWRFNASTGVGTLVGSTGFSGIQALEFDVANQVLLGWDTGPGTCVGAGLVTINPATGLGTDVNPSCNTSLCDLQGLCFDAGGTLWGVGDFLWEIDRQSGCRIWTGNCALPFYRGVEIANSGFGLNLVGNCPGQVTIDVFGATPQGPVGIAYARGNLGSTVGAGPCAGTSLALSGQLTVIAIGAADAQGGFSVGPQNVPAQACGNIYVQGLDVVSCGVTNLGAL